MPAPHDPQLALSQLAYEQASAALVRQLDALNAFASRSAALFAAGVVSSSLFGGWVLTRVGSFGPLGWAAITALPVVLIASLRCASPLRRLEGAISAPILLEAAERDQRLMRAGAAHRAVAEHLAASYAKNEATVTRIASELRIALTFQGVAVVCWVADLLLRA
ncbi:MAG TPA: hypothetical protein VLK58_20955 [Conexibacter sp.]|nr:hypothetical protein [Conexibacter sp.]